MADRNLATYTEDRLEDGPYWTLEIDRSAAGQRGLFFTIRHKMHDPAHSHLDHEMTVVVKDGNELLAPVLDWLGHRRDEKERLDHIRRIIEMDDAELGDYNEWGDVRRVDRIRAVLGDVG